MVVLCNCVSKRVALSSPLQCLAGCRLGLETVKASFLPVRVFALLSMASVPQKTLNWLWDVLRRVKALSVTLCDARLTFCRNTTTQIEPTPTLRRRFQSSQASRLAPMSTVSRVVSELTPNIDSSQPTRMARLLSSFTCSASSPSHFEARPIDFR